MDIDERSSLWDIMKYAIIGTLSLILVLGFISYNNLKVELETNNAFLYRSIDDYIKENNDLKTDLSSISEELEKYTNGTVVLSKDKEGNQYELLVVYGSDINSEIALAIVNDLNQMAEEDFLSIK